MNVTHYLVTEDNPAGKKLEDVLCMLRKDILERCALITDDQRVEAKAVLANNMRILNSLTDAILLAEDSTSILDKAFGPSQASKGGPPRIGHL
ncbi:MAG: histidine kinase [Sneathiella sp.]|nr:histidine kinase [Sneathiella sp.]